jgi:DsbC/DsbD-like thiol-disulfide interchange protein
MNVQFSMRKNGAPGSTVWRCAAAAAAIGVISGLCSDLNTAIAAAAVGVTMQSDDPAAVTYVQPRLISEHKALIPGQTAMLGVVFNIAEPWHIYWIGQNDTGSAPEFKFKWPKGFEAKPFQWPGPTRHVAPGDILDHIYEHQVTVLIPVAVPGDAVAGSEVTISADLDWLVCSDVCVPESGSVTLKLPVIKAGSADFARLARTTDAPLIDAARAALPKPLPTDGSVKVELDGMTATIRAAGAKLLQFMPLRECSPIEDPLKQTEQKGETLTVRLVAGPQAKLPRRLIGVVAVHQGDSKGKSERPAYYFVDLPKVEATVPTKSGGGSDGKPAGTPDATTGGSGVTKVR